MITRISVENVKGVSDQRSIEFDLPPNRPNLLVAPNGFGKSSFAAAFLSMNSNRIVLNDDHFHNGNAALPPKLEVTFRDEEGVLVSLEATSDRNTIADRFDWLVINNIEKTKGVGRSFGGRTTVSAFTSIDPIVLVNTIPDRTRFSYSYTTQKEIFGVNGKVLPNITQLLANYAFIEALSGDYSILDRASGVRVANFLKELADDLNAQGGTADQLRAWLSANWMQRLRSHPQLSAIALIVSETDSGGAPDLSDYLAALQIISLYRSGVSDFKKACKYSNYNRYKMQYTDLLTAFNSSSQAIAPSERQGKLVVEFPKTHLMSNGERDVLTFVCLLQKAKRKLRKKHCILVIDEVFDYLDDANLTAVQYYVTTYIEEFKQEGRYIYPLILTHLNPYYFKNYAFSRQKEFYLRKTSVEASRSIINLLRKREDSSIKDAVSSKLLHFHPNTISKRDEFQALRLKETWGESDNFKRYTLEELEKYCSDQTNFDPLAVCCAVRCKIEEAVYTALQTQGDKDELLGLHTTRKKLEYARSKGVEVPEYYFLLGIIYNEGMHWKENRDIISPIVAKLENSTIKHIIGKVT